MAFYIRKSVSAGPFRFNFSKGGVGLSVGVKGLRLGTGPRGHYIHAGRGGLYYRSSIGRAGSGKSHAQIKDRPTQSTQSHNNDAVRMIAIESGDVLAMQDAKLIDLLNDINARNAQAPLAPMTLWLTIGLTGIALVGGIGLAIWPFFLGIIAWLVARSVDTYRRRSVLFYDLEDDALAAYTALVETFENLSRSDGQWHIAAEGQIHSLTSWKQNSGANHLVDKKSTSLTYALPAVVACNITPPRVDVGLQSLYFLPDVVLVEHGRKMGAISYSDLRINGRITSFIEEGPVPKDAIVIGHTWKHPNKNGGPDRRFANNFQIPICRYEDIYLTSPSGLNERLQFSRCGLADPLSRAVSNLAALPR